MINQALQNLLETMQWLAESERLLSRLYGCCAEIWQEEEAFWRYLEREESGHVTRIEEMAERIRQDPDRFQLNRPFNATAIRTFMAGAEENIDRLKKGFFSRQKALILARDIESAIIEKSYHEIVKTEDLHYRNLVKQVVTETFAHKSAIEKKLKESVASPSASRNPG